MLQRFLSTLHSGHLYADGQQVLAAVSGGRDSVTLVHLLASAQLPFAIVHCNFHLRPGDCDRDEAFVRQLAQKYGVRCFVAQFDTNEYASLNGLSIEDAARRLRYSFFEDVRRREGFDLIATAHHRNDTIETFFINLLRGTGVRGLRGIPLRNGSVIRPMLSFGRDEIDRYVADNRLEYVDDYTNSQTLYLRNRIRHTLIPLMRELSPSFDTTMQSNMNHLAFAECMMTESIEHFRRKMVYEEDGIITIDISILNSQFSILNSQLIKGLLFELLHPYGFNSSQVNDVFVSLSVASGPKFCSERYTLLKDRNRLVLFPVSSNLADSNNQTIKRSSLPDRKNQECYFLDKDAAGVPAIGLSVTLHNTQFKIQNSKFKIIKLPPNEACFDYDKLRFPLMFRRWRDGDRFHPFGMKGSKLVSDVFTDLKVNMLEKQRAWIMCDAEGEILWVVGYRASSRCAVSAETQTIYMLKV